MNKNILIYPAIVIMTLIIALRAFSSENILPAIIMAVVFGSIIMIFIGGMYNALYTGYVNKRLKEKSYSSERNGVRLPDVSYIIKAAIVVLFFGLFISINKKIDSLQDDIERLYENDNEIYVNNYDLEIDELTEKIEALSKTNRKLAKAKSMVSDMSVSFGKLNTDNHTANVSFVITAGDCNTKANHYLLIGKDKKEVELKATKKGVFEGSTTLGIFSNYKDISFVEESDGKVKSEKICPQEKDDESIHRLMGWYEDASGVEYDYEYGLCSYNYLLDPYCYLENEDGVYYDEDTSEISLSATIGASKPDAVKGKEYIKEAKVIVEVDREKKEEIPLDVDELNKNGEIKFDYGKKYDGYSIYMYLELKDSYGYRYLNTIWSKSGDIYEDGDETFEETEIYDKNDKRILIHQDDKDDEEEEE